jgi:hypothetical protein
LSTLLLALGGAAWGQLNQNCTVSVLNRTVPVNADGSWVLPNIPANFGQIKARATCIQNGQTVFGESNFFTVPANNAVNLPAIQLGATTPIPVSLKVTSPASFLNTIGQTAQLTVTATYPDNSTKDVSGGSSGTNFTTSNASIASITPDGLVTAVASGTVVIQATNDGASGILTLQVVLGGASHGGLPDSWITAHGLNINDPTLPFEDPDHDGLTNLQEFQQGTDPNNPDTDGDGLNDGDEVNKYHTSPLLPDTDGDRIPDGVEVQTGTDPLNPASYDLKKATATSTLTPPSFTLATSAANPVLSVQLNWQVTLIDGKTTLNLTTDPRTNFSSSNLNVCNFGVQPGLVFSSSTGTCTITLSQNTLSMNVPGAVTDFTPTEISTLNVLGAVAVDVAGTFAYVAAGTNGLIVVDVTDRTKPHSRGTLGNIGNAQAVRASGQTVFVADGNGFLRIVNAQNPDAPAIVTSLAISGAPSALALHGGMIAVAAQSGGVSVVNVGNPAAPSLMATFSVPGSALGIDFDSQSGIAAVAMGTAGLQLADISNPASPRLRGLLAGGDVRRVLVRLPAAILADTKRSVTAVNISNPDQPVLSTSLAANLGGIPVDIAAFGNLAITADVTFGRAVPLINISSPLQPSTSAFWTLLSPGFSSSVAVDIAYGYLIIPATNTLRILQYQTITDPFGIPPAISITSPVSNTPLIQGQTVTFAANATDDVAVASVSLFVNGQVVFTTSTEPYGFTYIVPLTDTSLTFGGTAVDYGNNTGTAQNLVVPVLPDPGTTAEGRVVDGGGNLISGATVSAFGKSAVTAIDGTFSLAGLPTVQGPITVLATGTLNGVLIAGSSGSTQPVSSGITNVGVIRMVPKPAITGLKQKGVVAGTVVSNFAVQGANLTGATFSLVPATNPPPISITVISVNPSGSSAVLALNVAANASGQFVIVATNAAGSSDPTPSAANSITILRDPSGDADGDGLPNGLEAVLGTDPLNPDTDGDGFSDGIEVATRSDPLNPACTPLNCRVSGEVETIAVSALNTALPASQSKEADSIAVSLLNGVLPTSSFEEAESLSFSALNTGLPVNGSREAESIVFSVESSVSAHVTQNSQSSPADATTATNARDTTPLVAGLDSDGDGLPDDVERMLGTDPFNPDTDGDGYPDGLEVTLGSDPLDQLSTPDIRPPAVLILPLLDVNNLAIINLNRPADQPAKGDQRVVQAQPARRSSRNALARFRAFFH